MDVSLDDYISRKSANFKVEIRNPSFTAGNLQKTTQGKFFQKEQGFAKNIQKRLVVNKPGQNKGSSIKPLKTSFDARQKLSAKSTITDAREKLSWKDKPTDARDTLTNIRIHKGTLDARAKIQAKQQKQGIGNKNIPVNLGSNPGATMNKNIIMRTVNNNGVVNSGADGSSFSISRTVNNNAVVNSGAKVSGFNISRTVSNNAVVNSGAHGSVFNISRTIGNTEPPSGSGNVQFIIDGLQITRPVNPPVSMAQNLQQHYRQPQNDFSITRMVDNRLSPFHGPGPGYVKQSQYPLIQVSNDHYQQPPPHQSQPVHYPHSSQAPYPPLPPHDPFYQPLQQPTYPTESEISYQMELSPVSEEAGYIQEFVVHQPVQRSGPSAKTVIPASQPNVAVKRKLPGSGGTLKLSRPSAAPVIDLPAKKAKTEPNLEERLGTADDDDLVISPLQGFRVQVTNLHSVVSQDDIIELFGAIGAMKRARLVKPGMAEIVYVKKEDSLNAVQKYHNRELDGMPMQVKLVTPASARVKEVAQDIMSVSNKTVGEPLKFNKKPAQKSEKNLVELGTLHKALFKTGSMAPSASKPVTFTVKI
ncbi:hypothetical protein CHS0354_028808 [Potamilus streckersoni]|uniref:RRM domain-containing protein n=1 Tax=Potamilus streckersoni TaxID=2493646 RepID=A0AAE0W1M5_9BIVA|nr:hypothetical protein CHS0354_028808 [Potamilus streckersoni]